MIDFIFKWTLRIIQPSEAKRMEQDGPIALPKIKGALPDGTEYVFIDDQGADTTVFAYSGMDALFAGRARFEFKRIFRSLSVPCNLVCFRDPRTSAFHIGYDDESLGIDFYTEKTREIMEQLGATHNIALGSSSGGMAAFTFGTLCKMDKIIGFSPAFPHTVYRGRTHFFQSLFNFRALFREPQAYIEVLIVTVSVIWMEDVALKRIRRRFPLEIWDTWGIYEGAGDKRPNATVYYGERSAADTRQAKMLAEAFPEQVRLEALDTGRHNCPAVLLQQDRLVEVLDHEISMVAAPAKTQS
ncbi:MAG: hypothetical protein L3K26_16620 [Candidatus Hydrogenedentes bacterium]|nr:hypothetical protein [Candidatus Hydrogenedentota bacterium]